MGKNVIFDCNAIIDYHSLQLASRKACRMHNASNLEINRVEHQKTVLVPIQTPHSYSLKSKANEVLNLFPKHDSEFIVL